MGFGQNCIKYARQAPDLRRRRKPPHESPRLDFEAHFATAVLIADSLPAPHLHDELSFETADGPLRTAGIS